MTPEASGPVAAAGPRLRIAELAGSPRAMGEAFGAQFAEEIRRFYQVRLAGALADAARHGRADAAEPELLALAARSLPLLADFDPAGHEELLATAGAAGLRPEQLLALQGLTDFRDALAWPSQEAEEGGCTAFLVQRDASADGRLWQGQTWDLATDNQPFVVGVRRRPAGGPASYALTTVGCPPLVAVGEQGLAIGTTNLRTRDARAGIPYLSLIARALAEPDAEAAARCIEGARRAGGHAYLLSDARGRAIALECSAGRARRTRVERGVFVQANHCHAPEIAACEAPLPQPSSRAREPRLRALLASRAGRIDAAFLRAALADAAGGPLAICREDFDGISSNGAFVGSPEGPEASACQGPPSRGRWVALREA